MRSDIEKSILATLAYHDMLNFPLTEWEVFSYSLSEVKRSRRVFNIAGPCATAKALGDTRSTSSGTLHNFLEEIERLKTQGIIGEKNGYYFLKGREDLYAQRIKRMKIADEKWQQVRWVLRWYRFVPFVRSVFLSGSVALGNATEKSDVDVMIVAKSGRIWMVRFLLLALTFVCGKLRSARISKKTSGKICPNHFITTDSLAISADVQSPYNAATYAHLVPVFAASWLEKFYIANEWIFAYFPNALRNRTNRRTLFDAGFRIEDCGESESRVEFRITIQWIFEFLFRGALGNFLEKILRAIQKRFVRRNILSHNIRGRVVASDRELAFHPESPENEILDRFAQKMVDLHIAGIHYEFTQ